MISGVRILLLGKQGAGKGTQAVRVAAHYGIPHISTGDMFRTAVAAGTEFGRKAEAFMEAGDLVPDDIVIGVVRDRLADCDVQAGFVLDGFPRTRAQAEALEQVLDPFGIDAVIDLEIPADIVLGRLSGRRACVECGANYHIDAPPKESWLCDVCGGKVVQRTDDTPESILHRLELYESETHPLVDFYTDRGVLLVVEADGSVDEIFKRIVDAISSTREPLGT